MYVVLFDQCYKYHNKKNGSDMLDHTCIVSFVWVFSVLSILGLPVSNVFIFIKLQDVFNLLPNLNVAELIKAFAGEARILSSAFGIFSMLDDFFSFGYICALLYAVKTNDMMLVIYLSSLIRSVIALHNLINNKVICPLLL